MLNVILWDVDPEIFKIGPIAVRWYGLLFALAFLLGYHIVERMFKAEKIDLAWLDKLFLYTMIATVIGARLGHVFFYGWDYYSKHLGEILKIWHGGLASHGAAIGIILALWIYSKYVSKRSVLWILDRVVVPVALAGCFIRFGNLMNSEIVGTQSSVAWAFKFVRASIDNPSIPRHPAQLYESICYLGSFGVLMYMYWKTDAKARTGMLFGSFLVMIFTARFFIEFIKENQEAFEEGMALNMGQLLSIPFVILGAYFVVKNLKAKKV